jgi:hypothetical protein
MYYEIRINGVPLAVVGHPNVANMHLSLAIDDSGPPDVFASAVCREGDALFLYDWLQHPVAPGDKVEFVLVADGVSIPPRNRYEMKRK